MMKWTLSYLLFYLTQRSLQIKSLFRGRPGQDGTALQSHQKLEKGTR